ncbi:MAG: transcriptional repressor [Clostridia bacterium]|nr:transcriptional repressor [Clostridia bacterium]
MRNSGYNTSGKRRLIAFLAKNEHKEFSVQSLYEALLAEGLKTPKSSLYRLLEKLCESGAVRKFRDAETDLAVFQYVGDDAECARHLHLKCKVCGRLIHLHCDLAGELVSHISAEHGFRIDSKGSVLYGLCRSCAGEGEI